VFGGSGDIVARMTGIQLSTTTSWGVGNVMEFYINFGIPGVIGGFLILGFAIGALDRRAVIALRSGDPGASLVFFLPCVALIQPIGSMVELSGGVAAALAAAFLWRQAWLMWSRSPPSVRPRIALARPSAQR